MCLKRRFGIDLSNLHQSMHISPRKRQFITMVNKGNHTTHFLLRMGEDEVEKVSLRKEDCLPSANSHQIYKHKCA